MMSIMSTVSSIIEDELGVRKKPKGAVIFTGPDGRRDYRARVEKDQFYIGHGHASPEASCDTSYICRPAPNVPYPVPKSARVGEIGWGIPDNTDHSLLKSGNQIMLNEFRQVSEDRYTHRHQAPYYPPQSSSRVVSSNNRKLYNEVPTSTTTPAESDHGISQESSQVNDD